MNLGKIKRENKKAFTLIELLVVMAIIGVLAVTIIPQVTGAQARSRDTGRLTSIKNISAVLNTYQNDEGEFPAITNLAGSANGCLSNADGKVITDMANLLKGNTAPIDPQKKNLALSCEISGSYYYVPLIKDGISNNSFLLGADMESYKTANATIAGITAGTNIPAEDGTSTYETFVKRTTPITWGRPATGNTNAKLDVYLESN